MSSVAGARDLQVATEGDLFIEPVGLSEDDRFVEEFYDEWDDDFYDEWDWDGCPCCDDDDDFYDEEDDERE